MNITLENIDAVNAVITVEIAPEDYQEQVKKSIKDFRKKAHMPGFRQGMVPEGLVRKQYGASILAEEVNKLLQEKLFGYIQENKVKMLGEPFAMQEGTVFEPVDGNSFTFKFEIALSPEFSTDLSADDKIPYYDIDVTDEMVENQVNAFRNRGGQHVEVDSYEDNDMVKGVITEVGKEDGISEADVVMLPHYFKSEEQKALFNGAKVNDVITFNPTTAYEGSETELSSLLKIEKEKVGEHTGDFTFQITSITRYQIAELNEDLFEQVYPGAGVKTAEEFTAKIRETIERQFAKDADFRFLLDVKNYLTEKIGKLQFPEEKLRRMMTANANGDEEKVNENFEKSLEGLTWHLIKEQIVEQEGIKVEQEDVVEMAKESTRMQFAQYGMLNIPDEYLEGGVKEMMKSQDTITQLVDRCIDVKLGTVLKEKVTLEHKKVSTEEFNKLFE